MISIDVPGCDDPVRIYPNFAQDNLGIDVDELWSHLRGLSHYDLNHVPPSGDVVAWLPGANMSMKYRGNGIRRTKMWFQTGNPREEGLVKYGYTGWQWLVAPATVDIQRCTPLAEFTERLNAKLESDGMPPHNHWIATKYMDGTDTIGAHSDKTRTIAEGTEIVVIKLGPARPFKLETLDGTVLFEESLEAGTAIFMRSDGANVCSKHSVPPVKGFEDVTGSIVGRTIKEIVPWAKVDKEVTKRLETLAKKAEEIDP